MAYEALSTCHHNEKDLVSTRFFCFMEGNKRRKVCEGYGIGHTIMQGGSMP